MHKWLTVKAWRVYSRAMIRKSRGGDRERVTSLDLVRRLARFGPAYMRWVGRHLPDDGTSAARLRLLGTLRERGPMSIRALKAALSVSAQNVSVMVDGLAGQGLVRRDADPRDRRIVLVALTPLGAERVDAGMAVHQRAVSALFDCLDDGQRAQLAGCLDRLNAELEDRQRENR